MAQAVEIDAAELVRNVTLCVKVTGARRARFRLWIGGKVLLLAAYVMGCNIEVSGNDQN